jgi:xanthine dehydrogenase accessory factor
MDVMAQLTARDIVTALDASLGAGRALAIVSLLARDGQPPAETPRLLIEEETTNRRGSFGDAALDAWAAEQAAALMADETREIIVAEAGSTPGVRLLFEVSRPQPEVLICGGGHVGQAVAKAARLLDFAVTVIDDRAEFASRDKFPDPRVRLRAEDFVAALQSLRLTRASHVVIVTRGHRHDEICLKEVIESPARYIGMIGSRRRTTTIREHLRREGVAAEHLRRVHAPIGLDIGAMTPEEIALAIMAEIVLVRRGGTGRPKSADGPMAHAR